METRKEFFLEYLKVQQEQCMEAAQELIEEERRDEAAFQKAKANIYDVFATLFKVSEKQAGGDERKTRMEFEKKADHIPQSWKHSHEMAKKHDDAEKMLMEESKLAVVEDIMTKYKEIWEA